MKVAVIGATGVVGQAMLRVLEERDFPVGRLIPVASSRSIGRTVKFRGVEYSVVSLAQAVKSEPDIALFSAGGGTSKEWAHQFTKMGCTVIDNSSAWRMEKDIPLVIPEINPDSITSTSKIIANPNCSTIQMLMVLAPLHQVYRINRIVVSTYQSVTGSGQKATKQLADEASGLESERAYPHQIFNNCLPHCADFDDSGYTTEEIKLVNETRKILNDESIKVSATAVRVPVTGGHSESVNVEFFNEFDIDEVRRLLREFPGVVIKDDPVKNIYPMPLYSEGDDNVFVGRLRRDLSRENTLNMWVVSDNIRKGAATNAVQIAELLLKNRT